MELFDVIDEKGDPTGEIVERKKAHREGVWHRTSHLWILRKREGKNQVLLQKRCETKDSFPGCYDISSAGHIPAGMDYVTSAIRELKEELGLDAKAEDLIYCGSRRIVWDDEFHGIPYHDRQHTRVYLIWMDVEVEDITVQPEEVESVMWMDLDECVKAVRLNSFKHCMEMEELQLVLDGVNRC